MAKSTQPPKMAALTADDNEATKAPAKKTAAKKATTKKAATKKAATKKTAAKKTRNVDLITSSATEVESLTKAKALKLAPELIESNGLNDFKLGGILLRIQQEKWWDGEADSFKAYIEETLGMAYRKSMYLINIYEKLVEAGIKWDQVKMIGWSKLRFIVDFLTAENVGEWVQRCMEMNSLEIQEYVRSLKEPGTKSVEEGEEVPTTVTTLTFKVHPDQKELIRTALDKKREEIGTEYDAVALENMALDYIEGGLGKSTAKAKIGAEEVVEYLKKLGADEALKVVLTAYPEWSDED